MVGGWSIKTSVQVSPRQRGAPRLLESAAFLRPLAAGRRLQAPGLAALGVSGTPYFSLPSSHTGNLLRSYGLSLLFSTSYSGSGRPVAAPLVVLRGGGRSIAYTHPEPLLPGVTNQVAVRFWPGRWEGAEGAASREELVLVLREVEQVLVRAQHVAGGPVDVTVEEVQLEQGRAGGAGAAVPWVEQCACPMGHTGLSCEVCAPGYAAEGAACRPQQQECPRGAYRDTEGGVCRTCPCPLTNPSNQFATECYLDRDTQVHRLQLAFCAVSQIFHAHGWANMVSKTLISCNI